MNSKVTGIHTVYLTFASGQPEDFVNVDWFTFATVYVAASRIQA